MSWRITVICLFLATAARLGADPDEKVTAWNDLPVGFHWELLGPRTVAVDPAGYSQTRYVSSGGSDESGDGSRSKPWRSLGKALAAAPAKGRAAVFVASGTYKEGTLTMQQRVDLYGGFDGRDWKRDIFRNPTILSGGGVNRVLVGANDCRLDGFIIEDGMIRDHGAGLFCHEASPVVTNNVFRRNRTLEPEGFSHDPRRRRQRGIDGGAVGLESGSNPDIRNNIFHDNETGVGYGGAIGAIDDCMPIIGHNVFWHNRAGTTDSPDTCSGNGGAVSLLFSSRAAVAHNLFVENEALSGSDGGAFFCEYFSWPEVRYNAFVNNHAEDDGGAFDNQKFSYPKVRTNLFIANRADGSGGAMHLDDSLVELENNVFAYNHAGKEAGGFGGTHGWFHARNNTVVYNEAGQDGGGIHIVNVKNPFLRPSILHNNIIALNKPEQILVQAEVDAAYNAVHPGGFKGGYYNFDYELRLRDDSRRLDVSSAASDPQTFTTELRVAGRLKPAELAGRIVRLGKFWSMVKTNTDDTVTLWGLVPAGTDGPLEIQQTYHLAPDSKAVNNGVYPDYSPVDFDNEPRYPPNVDIGADEYHAPAASEGRAP